MILKLIKKIFKNNRFDIVSYWKDEEIGGKIKFPILEFEYSGNGTINSYTSIEDIVGSWNHFIVEDVGISEEMPNIFIDNNLNVYKIVYNNLVNIREPKLIGKLTSDTFEELLMKAEIELLNLTNQTEEQIEIIQKKINSEE